MSIGPRVSRQANGLEVVTIIVIPAQIFPGEAGSGDSFCVSVCCGRTPVDIQHGVTSRFGRAMRAPEREISNQCWARLSIQCG